MFVPVESLHHVTGRSMDRRTLLALTTAGIATTALATLVHSAGATSGATPSPVGTEQILQGDSTRECLASPSLSSVAASSSSQGPSAFA